MMQLLMSKLSGVRFGVFRADKEELYTKTEWSYFKVHLRFQFQFQQNFKRQNLKRKALGLLQREREILSNNHNF